MDHAGSPKTLVQRIIQRSFHIIGAVAAVTGGLLAFAVLAAIGVSWLGIYNVAATAGHSPAFAWFLHFTMRNSVRSHASRAPAPPLNDPGLRARGEAYAILRCAPCHGGRGQSPDIAATKLLPLPPPMASLAQEFDANEVHWIIKHGVKMSAMPAWPTQRRDDDIWPLVAYLEDVATKAGAGSDEKLQGRSGIGGEVSIRTCFACHGSDGNGRRGVFPKLAGLSAVYIESSLKAYRSNQRSSGFMEPFAQNLSDADITNFSDYFSNLLRGPTDRAALDRRLITQGAKIAEPSKSTSGKIACLGCHVRGSANASPDIPDIAGQSDWYIENQLKLFRAGTRSGTPNADIMVRIAKDLSDEDIKSVSSYFASLAPGSQG